MRILGSLSALSLSFQREAAVVRAAQTAILEKGVPSSKQTLISELCCVSQLFNVDICISSLAMFKLPCH